MDTGLILFECELIDCVTITQNLKQQQTKAEIDFGDWSTGRYAWLLSDIKPLSQPIKIPGQLGLWNFDL